MQAVCFREIEDVASLEEKLGRALSKQERSRIGVSKLRLFLEELLQKRFLYIRFCFYVCLVIFFMLYGWALNNDPARYISNVPLIIPLLEKEYWTVTRKLSDINQELRYVLKLKLFLLYLICIARDKDDNYYFFNSLNLKLLSIFLSSVVLFFFHIYTAHLMKPNWRRKEEPSMICSWPRFLCHTFIFILGIWPFFIG